jgi:hypothetical protein
MYMIQIWGNEQDTKTFPIPWNNMVRLIKQDLIPGLSNPTKNGVAGQPWTKKPPDGSPDIS